MNKKQKLYIAESLKNERKKLNELYAEIRIRMNSLDDLEMYVRVLPVEGIVDVHDRKNWFN